MPSVLFKDLFAEARLSQERLLGGIKVQNDQMSRKINDEKQNEKKTFEKFYKIGDQCITYCDPMSIEKLETASTCDDEKFRNCLSVLKKNNCHIYEVEEDPTQKKTNMML